MKKRGLFTRKALNALVGICAVLDRRVLSKRYGKAFIESLPDCTTTIGSTRILGDTAARWLGTSDEISDSGLW